MEALAHFSEQLSLLLPDIGGERFCTRLIHTVKTLVDVDEATVIVYSDATLPVIEFAEPDCWSQPNLDIFLNGAFMLDPYYLAAAKENRSGFFRLRELAPSGFRNSEYHRIYYASSGLRDECGFLVPLPNGGFVNIALGTTEQRLFTPSQTKLLRAIAPLVESLCKLHWADHTPAQSEAPNLRRPLESALACFGESMLTQREREVVNLLLLGHSTKTVAERLQISFETVKLHRKHAYVKLGINSQSELFYTFIDSLMHIKHYEGGDPLASYAAQKAQR